MDAISIWPPFIKQQFVICLLSKFKNFKTNEGLTRSEFSSEGFLEKLFILDKEQMEYFKESAMLLYFQNNGCFFQISYQDLFTIFAFDEGSKFHGTHVK